MKKYGNPWGMTLLEVLIALAIFAASATTLLSATGAQLFAVSDDERITQAVLLARTKMADIEASIDADIAKGKFPKEVEKAGHFEEPFDDFNWLYAIRKVELPAVGGGGENAEVSGYAARFVKSLMDDISKKLREVKLTIWWGGETIESEETQKVDVVTHIVDLN